MTDAGQASDKKTFGRYCVENTSPIRKRHRFSGLGEEGECGIAHETKNAVWTITSNVFETGILSESAPQNSLSLDRSALCATLLTPCSPLKPPNDTTPGQTQPSHGIVSYVVGLALVLLELEKSGASQPCDCMRCAAAL